MIKKLGIVFLLGLVGWVGFLLALLYAPHLIVTPRAIPYKLLAMKQQKTLNLHQAQGQIPLKLQSSDSIILSAVFANTPQKEVRGNIILIHGIRSSKEHMQIPANEALKRGYNVLLIDLRGHGDSGGNFCTFGFKEKNDLNVWIDWLAKKNQLPTGIWGHSLGAAVAVQTLANENRLAFGVIESSFSDYRSIVGEYARRYLGFNFPQLGEYLAREAARIAGMNLNQISPKNDAQQITQPVVVVHGLSDKRIKPSHGLAIYENLSSEHKLFIPLDTATHSNLWQVGGEDYFEDVFDFLEWVE